MRNRRRLLLLAVTAAVLFLPTVLHAQQTTADMYVSRAIAELDAKRYDEAVVNLQRALQLEPNHVEALYYSGVVELARGHPQEAVPFLERARTLAPQDRSVALQLGLAYFSQQQYERASPLLEEVFRSDPTTEGVGYYVGFMRYRRKEYRPALEAFRAGRSRNPEIQQLTRFYTALALAAVGTAAAASAELQEALRVAPGSPLSGPAERLRDAFTASARERERRLSVELRMGMFFDDNVAVVPRETTREPLVPVLRHAAHRSPGEHFGVRADYAWWRTPDWEASAGYSFFATYNNDLPKFNIMDHLGSLSLANKTTLGTLPLQTGLQYSFDSLFLDQHEFIRRNTVTLSSAIVEGDHQLTQLVGRYQNKDFKERVPLPTPDERRDADNGMLGALHLFRFEQDRHFLKFGYQWDLEDAEGRNWTYRGHRLLAGGLYTLPWKNIRLRYDVDAHLRDYQHKNTALPSLTPGTKHRHDEEFTNIARVEVPLPWSFTLSAEYLSVIARSNLAVFAYHRNVVSLILSWSYR